MSRGCDDAPILVRLFPRSILSKKVRDMWDADELLPASTSISSPIMREPCGSTGACAAYVRGVGGGGGKCELPVGRGCCGERVVAGECMLEGRSAVAVGEGALAGCGR